MSAADWRELIRQAHEHAPWPELDLPPWIEAQMHAESRGNPDAVSASGAIGLMQIMPATAWGEFKIRPEQLRDPAINVTTGLRYLRQLYDRLSHRVPDPQERLFWAFAGYNAGMLYVNKALELCALDQRQLDLALRLDPFRWDSGKLWFMHRECCHAPRPNTKLWPRYQETWNYVHRIREYHRKLQKEKVGP